MEWEVFHINELGGKTAPFVSIGRGALDFNAAACNLVNDNGNYKFARLLQAKGENGKPIAGVEFLEDYCENCIPITRKTQKGKQISGMTVRNKGAIISLFGKEGSNDGTVRHKVIPDSTHQNILIIID